MKNTKEVFMKIVQDFGLDLCDWDKCRTDRIYAKLPGYGGFLIDCTPKCDDYILVATNLDYNSNGPFFWGCDSFYDEKSAIEQVAKMIKKAKDLFIEKKLDKLGNDFACKDLQSAGQ
jgi:hypothetical protein